MRKILYVSADLRRVGPTNQTLNIICYANENVKDIQVLTLFAEPEKTMIQDYLNKGINVQSLNLQRGNTLSICIALFRYLKQNSFDLIHSNGVKPDICLYLVSKFIKISHIITLRNIPMEDAPSRMNKWIGRFIGRIHTFVIKHTENVVACSKTVRDIMVKNYRCDKIHAIQNGVDVSKFTALNKAECREKLGISKDSAVFISTGSFIPRKHNDLLIDAFLSSNIANSELILLGDGYLLNDLKEKYSNHPNIHFEGLVSNIPEYLSASDAFISASDSEGLPNAVLEAISCNIPVILSNIPQHQEILNEMPNCGSIFELNNTVELSNLICTTYNNLNKYSSVAEQLQKSPLTMEKMGLLYKEFYKHIRDNQP